MYYKLVTVFVAMLSVSGCGGGGEDSNPDTQAPVIAITGDNPANLVVGDAYTDPGATASDNVDGDITANIIVTGSVDTSTVDTYTITYSVTDTAGNEATADRTVYVVDNIAPIITLIGDNPMTVEAGAIFSDPGASVTDNVDSALTSTVTGTVNTTVLGNYTLTYNATDSSGNDALAVTRTVNVVDTTAPVITLNGDDYLTVKVNTSFADPGVSIMDNLDTGLAASVTGTVDTMTPGIYTLTYNVTDSSGNSAVSVTRTIHVSVKYQIIDLGLGFVGDINENGIAAGVSNNQAYLFDGTNKTYIGTIGSGYVTPSGINIHGEVVATYRPVIGSYDTSIAYYDGSEWTLLGKFGSEFGYASDINDSGQITGAIKPAGSGMRAFIYTSGTLTLIPVPGKLPWESAYNDSMEINNNGLVTGTYINLDNINKAYISDGVTVNELGTLSGQFNNHRSYGKAINAAGHSAGHSHDATYQYHAFIYKDSVMSDLGILGSITNASDINNFDVVVGDYYAANGNNFAYIHDGTSMQDLTQILDHEWWVLETAKSINDAGIIIGTGIINNESHGYMLIPLD
ncbi:MAG: DUF5011 domain-containing protein [Gammaproteobacteria bacterium]